MPRSDVVVAVATYRRPQDIARCLTSLAAELEHYAATAADPRQVCVVVVDNDAEGGARTTVTSHSLAARVSYVVEPVPGISAARNRALREAGNAELLIFIDDDEEVVPGWLGHLLDTYDQYRPAAVAGRVRSVFEAELPAWLDEGRFFRRRTLPTGTLIDVAATNNLLLDLRVVRGLGLQFDAGYGLTGGGDTDFTRRLVQHGQQMRWCDEALVLDHVPAERATREWVLSRARRTGNSEVVVACRLASGVRGRAQVLARALARGVLRVLSGLLLIAAGRLTRSMRLDARGHKALARGRGMIDGVRGRTVAEYRRGGRTVRVLTSFPQPGPQTNPYIAQLAAALTATDEISVTYFTWRDALIGRYDVVHLHWPETLLQRGDGAKRALRQALFGVLVLRWRLTRAAVVQTLHNPAPHERLSPRARFLLRQAERCTTSRILLNSTDLAGPGDELVPHGHYVDWYRNAPRPRAEPGRVLFSGLIRPYKNVPQLIAAFAGVEDRAARLHIAGKPSSDDQRLPITTAAAGDRRVSLDLRFQRDDVLAYEIGRAQLVALPYAEMHNSGVALLALSLGRPVLVPDNDINRALADEVGERWVQRYRGKLTAAHLVAALAATRDIAGAAAPDLSAREWTQVGIKHRDIYRAAVTRRRGSDRAAVPAGTA